MAYNPDIHHRRSIRLKNFDYSSAGAYFVTICVQNRECLLGEIRDGTMILSDAGYIVESAWRGLQERFANVIPDAFVIMPNHFHGIAVITDHAGAGSATMGGMTPPLRRPTLGQIIGFFKYQSTKQINDMHGNPAMPVWQRDYYEHIIRDEDDLTNIRQYISDNPVKWGDDENNPLNFTNS